MPSTRSAIARSTPSSSASWRKRSSIAYADRPSSGNSMRSTSRASPSRRSSSVSRGVARGVADRDARRARGDAHHALAVEGEEAAWSCGDGNGTAVPRRVTGVVRATTAGHALAPRRQVAVLQPRGRAPRYRWRRCGRGRRSRRQRESTWRDCGWRWSTIRNGFAPGWPRCWREIPNVEIAFAADTEGEAVRLVAAEAVGRADPRPAASRSAPGSACSRPCRGCSAREPRTRSSSPTTASGSTASARSRSARSTSSTSRATSTRCEAVTRASAPRSAAAAWLRRMSAATRIRARASDGAARERALGSHALRHVRASRHGHDPETTSRPRRPAVARPAGSTALARDAGELARDHLELAALDAHRAAMGLTGRSWRRGGRLDPRRHRVADVRRQRHRVGDRRGVNWPAALAMAGAGEPGARRRLLLWVKRTDKEIGFAATLAAAQAYRRGSAHGDAMKPATEADIETVERRLEVRRAMVVTRYEDLKEGVDARGDEGRALVAAAAPRREPRRGHRDVAKRGACTGADGPRRGKDGFVDFLDGQDRGGLGLVATAIRIATSSEARACTARTGRCALAAARNLRAFFRGRLRRSARSARAPGP